MNASPDLPEVIDAYLDGEIDEDHFELLRTWLEADSSHTRQFARHVFLHQQLRDLLVAENVVSAIQEESAEDFSFLPKLSAGFSVRLIGVVGVVLIAVAVFTVLHFRQGFDRSSLAKSPHAKQQTAIEAESGLHDNDHGTARSSESVARITRLWKPVWSQPAEALSDWSSLHVGQVLQLDSGKAEIFFNTGAQLILEGPFHFEVLGRNRGRLFHGNVVTRVSEEARGFSLITSVGRVIDYGTEFGLRVAPDGVADLVVFDGEVGLEYAGTTDSPPSNETSKAANELRLSAGQGARIGRNGLTERIVSIDSARFPRAALHDLSASVRKPVISAISDNMRIDGAGPFYEIVHGGLDEDVLAYVDRRYEWNGLDASGMPEFLIGADYVKTFNDDKRSDIKIIVTLSQAADLYIFWDDAVKPAKWLKKDFEDTLLDIGIDEERHEVYRSRPGVLGTGPGVEVDKKYSIWHRRISTPGDVELGPIARRQYFISMYGIAAVATQNMSNDSSKRINEPKWSPNN